MNIGENNEDNSDESSESESGKALQEKFSGKLQSVYLNKQIGNYEQIKTTLELQEEIVCDKMHKAMSPISAISGYLELMKVMLEKDTSNESIERYRGKVEEGIGELGEIIENLYDAFDGVGQKYRMESSNEASSDSGRRAS